MILDDDEKLALNYILEIASEETSRKGCNDLNPEDVKLLGHLFITREDGDTRYTEHVKYDFDIVHWIRLRINN